MNILGIDTSGNVCSVALLSDNKIMFEYTTNYKRTHSVTLMPIIEELFKAMPVNRDEIDVYAVSSGPGSFTGLRIGSATVKGMAHVYNKPIASVSTLEVLANNVIDTDRIICSMIDARKGNVFYQYFKYEGNQLESLCEMKIDAVEQVLEEGKLYGDKIIVVGDGATENREVIEGFTACDVTVMPPHLVVQRGATVAVLGQKYCDEGRLENHMDHAPIYLRKSQAELEMEKKSQGNDKS